MAVNWRTSSFPVQWETLCKVVNSIYLSRFLNKHSKHFRGLRMTTLILYVYLSTDVGICHSSPPFSAITLGVQLLVSKYTVGQNIAKKLKITYCPCRFSHTLKIESYYRKKSSKQAWPTVIALKSVASYI